MHDSPKQMEKQDVSVLLVDGREDFAQTVEGFLGRQQGLEVLRVLYPGEDPLAQAVARRNCVVLVDLETPGLDSLALIRRLRLVLPDLGIVALSLSTDNAHYQAATRAGADALVYKARLVQDLMPAIRKARR
jgi:DNA-binding NarL/FixJ family response regulator